MTTKTVYFLVQIVAPQVMHLLPGLGDWQVTRSTQDGYEPLVLDFDLPKLVSLRLDVSYLIKSFKLLGNF